VNTTPGVNVINLFQAYICSLFHVSGTNRTWNNTILNLSLVIKTMHKRFQNGATLLSIQTPGIMTYSITTLGIMTFVIIINKKRQ
jgi:hypothetical protein